MRAAWRLAISNLSGRKGRTFLLVLVVALSAVLISAVGVAMGSVRAAVESRMALMIGLSDVKIEPRGGAGGRAAATLSPVLVTELARDPAVLHVVARSEAAIALRFGRPVWRGGGMDEEAQPTDDPASLGTPPFLRSVHTFQASTQAWGIDPALEAQVRPLTLVSGRLPEAPDEIVLDEALVERLSSVRSRAIIGSQMGMAIFARGTGEPTKADAGPALVDDAARAIALNASAVPAVGDFVELVAFGKDPVRLRIVGIAQQPPLGGSTRALMTIEGLRTHAGLQGLSQIDLRLREGQDPEAYVTALAARLPEGATAASSERITSGLERNQRANQLGFTLGTMMAFIAAGFIIMTGMSTAITERMRELAILRCIGARPRQLALSQLLTGGFIGGLGALLGVPVGVACAVFMLHRFEEQLQAPPIVQWDRVVIAFVGALVAGLVGAALPAFQAARVSPLEALASRARPARARTIALITAAGLLGVGLHLGVFLGVRDATALFFAYVAMGLPALMLGYFLLGVPAMLLCTRLLGPLLERALFLPRHLLTRSVRSTPYRFGFTAGAMMAGLALMVAIWTQGGAAVRDWIDRIRFPDAFAVGLAMPPEAQDALRQLPFVTDTCAISLHPVETTAFGIRGLTRVNTFFVAFEPEPFFRMSTIRWVQGDPATAIPRLEQGGAVIVAREFLVARGMGLGGSFTCRDETGAEHTFEIVGVVESPGLEIANNFFDVGEDFTQQRVHAVFGSRKDLRERFGIDTIGLIQMTLSPDVPDEQAMARVREALLPYGVLNAASGRQVKQTIVKFVNTTLLVSTAVAIFCLLVAGFGVANLIIAGVHARQFELGVLRAVGAQRGLLARLVLGEALLVALAACVLGTLMGVQGAFGGIRLNAAMWGIDLSLRPPALPIALGWLFVASACAGAALPTALALLRKQPRELLHAVRG